MPTIHASAVLIGARAALIRGPSGAGKSRLVLAVLDAAALGRIPFARLVADDRALVEPANGRLLVRPPQALAGMIEVRGVGILNVAYEPVAVVGWVVDLASEAAERLPEKSARVAIEGVALPQIALGYGRDAPMAGADALSLLLAATGAIG